MTNEIICPNKEEDFYRENQEHIDERRKELDQLRNTLKANKSKEHYWMRCPKCGEKMKEINLLGIVIEQCGGCSGLFFDSGELETLLEITDRRGFFSSVKRNVYNN